MKSYQNNTTFLDFNQIMISEELCLLLYLIIDVRIQIVCENEINQPAFYVCWILHNLFEALDSVDQQTCRC